MTAVFDMPSYVTVTRRWKQLKPMTRDSARFSLRNRATRCLYLLYSATVTNEAWQLDEFTLDIDAIAPRAEYSTCQPPLLVRIDTLDRLRGRRRTPLELAHQARWSRKLRAVDPDKVRARRFQLGLSEHALAARLGTEASVVRRVERGHAQNELDVELQIDLGCDFADLLADTHASFATPSTPAVTRAGMILAASAAHVPVHALAAALNLPVDETIATLEELDAQLAGVGQRVAWLETVAVTITAAVDATSVTRQIERDAIADTGLALALARVLAGVINGECTSRATQSTIETRALIAAGVISVAADPDWTRGSSAKLTEATRYDLHPEDQP